MKVKKKVREEYTVKLTASEYFDLKLLSYENGFKDLSHSWTPEQQQAFQKIHRGLCNVTEE